MYKVYFSPGEDCLDAIIAKLRNAKKEVLICVFTISDNRISTVVKEAYYRGVDVKIITDNKKVYDRGSDIFYLLGKGLKIKTDKTAAHMHHKFAVIDREISIAGSYNWTRSAEELNYEDLIVTDNRDITSSLLKEFNKLWDKFDYLKPR